MLFHRYSFYLKLRINQAKHSGPLIFGFTREDCRSTKSLRMASNNTSSRPSLKGKVAIVTGGCKGIGRGCVDVFGKLKIDREYDQEIPQSQIADNPMAPPGRAAQPPRDTRKTN